jgi:chemotaxis protein methyltransferase CheR
VVVQDAATVTARAKMREFAFHDDDFNELRLLVKRVTGIHLADSKRELVYGRVSRRLRALGLRSFREYRDLLGRDGDDQELVELCNAITTNLTAFFREAHHFTYFAEQFLQPLTKDRLRSRRLRFWSAGCSTGEEPYSMAITICETLPDWRSWDIKILATDIDSDVLERGRSGVYREDRLKGMSPRRVTNYFRERREGGNRTYEAVPELKSLISFKQLNLMHELPMRGPFDAIFCRNTVIYFDKETQRQLFARVQRLQRPGDLLFLGHSESLFKVSEAYTLIGKTIYRRHAT